MTLKKEITELCLAIHAFQTNIAPLKEDLFNIPITTKQLIWNHVIGESYKKATSQQFVAFFKKHGFTITQKEADLLIFNYSGQKDSRLSKDQFWCMFNPLTIQFTEQIMNSRQKKQVLAKCHQAHYKISDLLCLIAQKTVQFLKLAEKMKKNIVTAQSELIQISPLDPPHLQIYLHQHAPSLLRKDVELIFKHILKNQIICHKNFEQFFIPFELKSTIFNPNYLLENEVATEMKGLELMKYHWQNVNYMNNTLTKKPIYLDDRLQTGKKTKLMRQK